jgi:hypothetical protein
VPENEGEIVIATEEGVRINLARLEGSIAQTASPAPRRSAFAASFRHDLPADPAPEPEHAQAETEPSPPPPLGEIEPGLQNRPRAPLQRAPLAAGLLALLAALAAAIWLMGGR